MQNIESLEARVMLSANMVVTWNNVAIDVIRADQTLYGPTWVSRTFGMVNAAIFDAVNGVDQSYQPYLVHGSAPHGASMDAAIASAARDVLASIYPQQRPIIDSAYQQSLAQVPSGGSQHKGIEFGRRVGDAIIRARLHDGATMMPAYTPDGQPGHWQPDPLNPDQTALGVNWGNVSPFSMIEGAQFRPAHSPDMTSAAYADAFNEVKDLGAMNSPSRTADQTQIGYFWAYDRPAMGTPMIHYNQIVQQIAAQQHNTEVQDARLFFLTSIAQADAGIAAWDCKYAESLWRPITAIRRATEDGNPDTTADPNWTPLGAPNGVSIPGFTPPFPSYVSGHATFGAATFKVLEQFYGTDQISFTVGSDELPGVSRTYNSFTQAATENGRSRIYLGVHWNFDDLNGQSLGRDVANWTFAHMAQPRIFKGSAAPAPAPARAPLFSNTPIHPNDPLDFSPTPPLALAELA